MAKKKEEIHEILEHFSATDFDYDLVSQDYNVGKRWIRQWWIKYAEEFFGREVALMHKPFQDTSSQAVPSKLDEILLDLTGDAGDRPDGEMPKDNAPLPVRSDHELTGAPLVLSHELTVSEANARVAVKAANLKLVAMERLEDLLGYLPAEQVLKTIEVLDKIDDEPKDAITKKANSFMQLVQKQIIINRSKNNSQNDE